MSKRRITPSLKGIHYSMEMRTIASMLAYKDLSSTIAIMLLHTSAFPISLLLASWKSLFRIFLSVDPCWKKWSGLSHSTKHRTRRLAPGINELSERYKEWRGQRGQIQKIGWGRRSNRELFTSLNYRNCIPSMVLSLSDQGPKPTAYRLMVSR